jgi:hypothetical protein
MYALNPPSSVLNLLNDAPPQQQSACNKVPGDYKGPNYTSTHPSSHLTDLSSSKSTVITSFGGPAGKASEFGSLIASSGSLGLSSTTSCINPAVFAPNHANMTSGVGFTPGMLPSLASQMTQPQPHVIFYGMPQSLAMGMGMGGSSSIFPGYGTLPFASVGGFPMVRMGGMGRIGLHLANDMEGFERDRNQG